MKRLFLIALLTGVMSVVPLGKAHASTWTDLYATSNYQPSGNLVELDVYSYFDDPWPNDGCEWCPAVGWFAEISGSDGFDDWIEDDNFSWEGWENTEWWETWDWVAGTTPLVNYGAYVSITYYDYDY